MARTFCLLILFTQVLFCSERFWFSYKIVTANSLVIYEQKNIARLSVPYEGTEEVLCKIMLSNPTKIPEETFLRQHFDTLLPCFYPLASHLISRSETYTKHNNDRVELIIEPIRFTVDFKDEFATIKTVR